MRSVSRATGPSQPLAVSRRGEVMVPFPSPRASSAEPTLQQRSVEPVFHPPKLEPASQRPTAEPPVARPPPFEWLDLEIIPLGQKPVPRGYAVYAQAPRPLPAPVVLIETA